MGWTHVRLDDEEPVPDKPARRWVLSPTLGIDAFNFNVAVLDPGERLSRTHFHYHEAHEELFHIAAGRCRIEVEDGGFVAEPGDTVAFDSGPSGVHLAHNPFDEPCRLVAIGWPPDATHPVQQVATREELLDARSTDGPED